MTVYAVGPGRACEKLSAVVDRLLPGDVAELHGGIVDALELRAAGTAAQPITIRGVGATPVELNAGGAPCAIRTLGDHWVLENLSICHARDRGVHYRSHDITVRGCVVHHNGNGIMGSDHEAVGDIHVDRCELYANGRGLYAHQMYLCSWRPGTTATVEHCWIHDAAGGSNLKTRMPRNVIRYNWLENAASYALDIVDADNCPGITEGADLYGNVIFGAAHYTTKQLVHLGSDMEDRAPGNNGRFRLAHNLFVTVEPLTRVVNLHGRIASVELCNNIFVGRHGRFAAAVGAGAWPIATRIGRIAARNNWIHPGALEHFIDADVLGRPALDFTGTDPDRAGAGRFDVANAATQAGLRDLPGGDPRPRAGSACAAGADPAGPLAPEFEPVRGFLGVNGTPPRRADAGGVQARGPLAAEE